MAAPQPHPLPLEPDPSTLTAERRGGKARVVGVEDRLRVDRSSASTPTLSAPAVDDPARAAGVRCWGLAPPAGG